MSSFTSQNHSARLVPTEPPNTETGLAEWSSKIRELQREVDRDEEAEQQRLEQEISASRQARASRGYSAYDNTSQQQSGEDDRDKNSEGVSYSSNVRLATRGATTLSSRAQLSSSKTFDFEAVKAHVPTNPNLPKSGEPISLAAFMGGRASGPRLNKAPTQPEYNPDQYAPTPNIRSPHPIFGHPGEGYQKGKTFAEPRSTARIALPGLSKAPETLRDALDTPPPKASSLPPITPITEDRSKSSTSRWSPLPSPSTPKHSLSMPLPPQVTRGDRVKSTNASEPQPHRVSSFESGLTPRFPLVTSNSHLGPSNVDSDFSKPSLSSPSPSTSVVSPPALARPIQPSPKPANLLSLPVGSPKEPTPSISRLQGRGFVEKQIQARAQLEERGSPRADEGKKKSVLDRWPPASALLQDSSSSSSLQQPPSPTVIRAKTYDSATRFNAPSTPKKMVGAVALPAFPGAKHANPSETKLIPTIAESKPPPGSASTMISFIKPQKTGHEQEDSNVEEKKHREAAELETKSSLSHPTRERAKKPRRHGTSDVIGATTEGGSVNDHPASPTKSINARSPSAQQNMRSSQSVSASAVPVDKSEKPVPATQGSAVSGDDRSSFAGSKQIPETDANKNLHPLPHVRAGSSALASSTLQQKSLVPETNNNGTPRADKPSASMKKLQTSQHTSETVKTFEHRDEPLPHVNIKSLAQCSPPAFRPPYAAESFSAEILLVQGYETTPLQSKPTIIHDSELIMIVVGPKSSNSSVASTKVYVWHGRHWRRSDIEERKIEALASRHNSVPEWCLQGHEPQDLLYIIGNCLVIRQGARVHWPKAKNILHRVRSFNGCVFIDEVECTVLNLSSGFSFCLSTTSTIYVWYGRGSLQAERQAAKHYAGILSHKSTRIHVVELEEGQEIDSFWMPLGDAFIPADHWKFRNDDRSCEPRFFELTPAPSKETVTFRPYFSGLDLKPDSIIIADCFFEFFVLVGPSARGHRHIIRLALDTSEVSAITLMIEIGVGSNHHSSDYL
ncbi:hypothetical protein SISSUDRAFT_1029682 [Sistotremastrum suecicum HHB10207 ss-3]|uniref:Gelsolin-like domain-containing protein n=1 Tax=Sistotremastrum suecicum HHB10207 ss-3 TaxID=1314776 RepID=A0A166I7Y1_9AGAM|nr:hypothetical protein SISSUDRAFT_1029682 [Sistotremastrum suecicum HHB10207 ss-3]